MVLVNGKAESRITIADRGLQYGDGLFETIAFRHGKAEFLDAHIQRLLAGCERLSIPFQQLAELSQELNSVYQQLGDTQCIIKIIITRGCGGRGYFADKTSVPTRIISTHDSPSYPQHYGQTGITVRLCQHKLSDNSALAGIKHLNRLDNVIARNEWDDTNIGEGLLFDQSEYLIEGTMTNVFIVKSQQLITPLLNSSGVAGIMRAQIIAIAQQLDLPFKQAMLTQDDLMSADEVFVCNSVNGIWPVRAIADSVKQYATGPITQQLQQALTKVER